MPTPPRRPVVRAYLTAVLAGLCLVAGYGLGLRDVAGTRLSAPQPTAQLSAEDQHAFGLVWEALGQLERTYYRPDRLEPSRLAAGAAKGLVDAVGDPYTTLTDPRHGELTEAELRGMFDGVGVVLDRRDGRLQVVSPIAGSPAERAGLLSGDVIVSVDGQDVTRLSLADVAGRIRGPRDTQVTLALTRDGVPFSVAVVRSAIRLESVQSRLLAGDVPLAYVRISIFSEPTGQQLRDQLAPLLAQGSKAVVLDLRGNPGGYVTSAVDVASDFVRDGVVLYQERGGADAGRKAVRTAGNPQAPDLPIAVLIDRGSASAAEIVAAALRDNQRGVLVGERTFGKGTVQESRTLSDDSRLHVTVGQWVTPSGHPIQGEGLLPDLEVQAAEGRDAPLDAAVEYLLHG